MFYIELNITTSFSQSLDLNQAYCNIIISNDGLNDLFVYEKENLIAKLKPDETIEWRNYNPSSLRFKGTGNTTARIWAW